MPCHHPFWKGMILIAGLALAPSGPCRAAAAGTLLELGEVETRSVKELNTEFLLELKHDLAARAEQIKNIGAMAVFQQMIQEHSSRFVPSRKVRYGSVDAQGRERAYSGRVFLPSRKPTDPPTAVPIVVYQHATEIRRKAVGYFNKGDETMLGALAAELCGFAVAMPDGDGMGADPSEQMHAYCHGRTAAACVLDLVRAVKGELNGKRIFDDVNYTWDGEVYIVGYSEGGYIAMSAVKALATEPADKDIELTGAACMGGPFDFANATRALLADARTPYDRSYIPVYFIAAWKDLFPDIVSYKEALNPELLKTDASGNAEQWMKGELDAGMVTALIQARLTGNKDTAVPARKLLNEKWVKENVDNPASRLNKLLRENSLVGGWAPTAPVLLVHDPFDQTVKFSGTDAIFADWKKQNLEPPPIGIVRLNIGPVGTGHVGGALVAIPTAFIWIGAGMPVSLMAMTKEKIKAAINDALGMRERNPNRSLFPLSRIEYPAAAGARPYTLAYADLLFKYGKVKLYTLETKPVFRNQEQTPGLDGYTRLVKELKQLGDTFQIQPNTTYYMAVYPNKATVALTLKFTGGKGTYTANIKQVGKNKVVSKRTAALFSISKDFKPLVNTDSFENPEQGRPFIILPGGVKP